MGELIWQRLLKVQIVLYFVNWLEKSAEYKKQYEKMEKYSSNYCYGMSYDRTKWVYWNF